MDSNELEGKRIKLIRMEDPYTQLRPGSEGTCVSVDGLGQLQMQWDNGSTLALIPEIDEYKVMDKPIKESKSKLRKFFEFQSEEYDIDYLIIKLTELCELFEDEYDIDVYSNITETELNVSLYSGDKYYTFEVDLKGKILHKSVVDEMAPGQPKDVHKTTDIKFDDIDEVFDIIEKEIHKIIGVSFYVKKQNGDMKYVKTFEKFKIFESDISDLDIEVTQAAPNNNDGGVQIDQLTITVDGQGEFTFEIATAISGDIYVTYEFGEDVEFAEHFNLQENEKMKSEYGEENCPAPYLSYNQFKTFLSQNDPGCVGDEVEIDGFEIKITDFSHRGGMEFGFLRAEVNGEEFQLDVEQDATGDGLGCVFTYYSDEDEEVGKRNGIELEDEDTQSYFFSQYDRLCNEAR